MAFGRNREEQGSGWTPHAPAAICYLDPMSIDPAAVKRLAEHVRRLRACSLCARMQSPSVSGGPVASPVILVGQAPGDREPKLGRPFAWTAGRTLFRWFEESLGVDEATFRSRIYMAAVCRCFPGKRATGGDRVPDREEIENCSRWLDAEFEVLRPRLVLPVGKLAIEQFVPYTRLDDLVGRKLRAERKGHRFDLVPLPHPSGASPWHRMEPGRTLLAKALATIRRHEAFREAVAPRDAGDGRASSPPRNLAKRRSSSTPSESRRPRRSGER